MGATIALMIAVAALLSTLSEATVSLAGRVERVELALQMLDGATLESLR